MRELDSKHGRKSGEQREKAMGKQEAPHHVCFRPFTHVSSTYHILDSALGVHVHLSLQSLQRSITDGEDALLPFSVLTPVLTLSTNEQISQ